MASRRILIIGGSTRAAADSVRRAGWQPICADLFADLDLRATAEVIPVRDYPDSLPDDVAHVRADGWFYCGALENYPEIIERILATNLSLGPLLGSSPAALKLVRNPYWWSNTLRWEGFATLEMANQASPPALDGSWLQKPLRSAGGRLIRVWDTSAADVPFSEPHYFQAVAPGISLSAIFRVENGEAEWLGASRELGAPSASSPPSSFSYCGSCGPLEIREASIANRHSDSITIATKQTLTKMAMTLARQAKGLRGLVGLDFRLDGDNVWLTEVNPRYTASIELLELATGQSLLEPSQKSEIAERLPSQVGAVVPSNPVFETATVRDPQQNLVIKQIIYASKSWVAPDLSGWVRVRDPWEIPFVADIPPTGVCIEAGWPICTIMASGSSREKAEAMLKHRLKLFQDVLTSSP